MNSSGIILAISLLISTFAVSQAMQNRIGAEIDKYGANIVVFPKTQTINLPYGSFVTGSTTISEQDIQHISEIPHKRNILSISPKLYSQISIQNCTIAIIGFIPSREVKMKPWWAISGELPADGRDEALIGAAVSSALLLQENSTLLIGNYTVRVSGVLSETGSMDDYSVYIPLATAQRILNMQDKVSVVDVAALCLGCPIEQMAQEIMTAVPNVKATPIRQTMQLRMGAIEQSASFSLVLASIVLLVGCLVIMTTTMSSIYERRREIGALISLGADSSHLYKIVMGESLLLGLFSGAMGLVAGAVLSYALARTTFNIMVSIADIPVFVVPLSILLSTLSCTVASAYPAWKASKIDPVETLRSM